MSAAHGFPFIRSKCRDVDEPHDLRIVAGLGNYHPTIGMANKNDKPVLRCDNTFRDRHVVGERYRWVLDDAHVVTVLLQDLVDVLPAGAVHEAAVDENDSR